ncbi:hemolysin III family protein [Bdellovibrio sp. PAP01]|uniref:Hemolysin III family protein n=2 Tax=Bdellovibrio svalbardensis TaxID=2972972 RepID=A0ABT6DP73_9BACT|nr:hemolysin III family protein [Bdellovibrio svalbardensis]
MEKIELAPLNKPLLRGHFHQAAFFIAVGACAMLISLSPNSQSLIATVIYSLSLCGLFGVSALYHRPQWSPNARMWMRRLDHSAIFILIAGTSTPICMLAIPSEGGNKLLAIIWIAAAIGVMQSLFWVKAPKWLAAILYIIMGWLAAPYMPEMKNALGMTSVMLILVGGIIYTLGAVVYATKKPDPSPKYFGYHEIFHVLVIVAAALHFVVIAALVRS